jgi:molecular chaperone GrpE
MNPETSPARSVREIREAILREFETRLDCALSEEQPLAGLAADLVSATENGKSLPSLEGRCDLYSLWSALTALAQELKLQTRTFKQVNDTLAQLPEAVATAIRKDSSAELTDLVEEEEEEEEREEEEAASKAPGWRSEKQHIDLLLDLRDRLERGLNSVHEVTAGLVTRRRSRWPRWFGVDKEPQFQTRQVLAALEKGYTLTLDRLDEGLRDCDINPILCQGKEFDSHRMTAVELQETDAMPEGTVVGVYRSGYEWRGEVYRPAQVKVARRKLSDREDEQPGQLSS